MKKVDKKTFLALFRIFSLLLKSDFSVIWSEKSPLNQNMFFIFHFLLFMLRQTL
jgi:hypothetical protein